MYRLGLLLALQDPQGAQPAVQHWGRCGELCACGRPPLGDTGPVTL